MFLRSLTTKKVLIAMIVTCAPVLLLRPANAATFTLNGQSYTTQFNTGSGPNHSLMVLEYGSAKYAFGYAWSGSKTGYDMLTDITANSAGNMTIEQVFFQLDPDPAPLVPFVEAIDYLTHTPSYSFPDDFSAPGFSWFGYNNADGGADWTSAFLGAASRSLLDNSADDWVYQDVPPDLNYNPQLQPTFVITVPEPGALMIMTVAGMGLLVRRRK